jgi:hypothetical protein
MVAQDDGVRRTQGSLTTGATVPKESVMATAMQQEDKPLNIHTVRRRPEGQSVAEQRFREIISYKRNHETTDHDLWTYASIWCEEELARAKAIYPSDLWCFEVSVNIRGSWAAEILPFVPVDYPKTRKAMAKLVVDGLLGCKHQEDEAALAQVLRSWPKGEGKLIADAIRETFEFRNDSVEHQKIGRFFGLSPDTVCNPDVARTMIKAAVIWLSVPELFNLGQLLYILTDKRFADDGEHCRRQVLLDMLR